MKPFRALQFACYHLVAQPVGSTKLACAGSWDIRSEHRLFPNDLSCLHGLQILPFVL